MKDTVLKILQLVLAAIGGGLTTQGITTESEVTAIIGGVIAITGAVWAIWERRKAVAAAAGKIVPLLLVGLLFAGSFTVTGCNLTQAEKEAVASVLSNVAKAGINVGLQALAAKVPALSAVVPVLQARFEVTFSEITPATTPAELAAAIRADVITSVADPASQEAIIAILTESLGAEIDQQATVTAAGPQSAEELAYALSVKAALQKGQS